MNVPLRLHILDWIVDLVFYAAIPVAAVAVANFFCFSASGHTVIPHPRAFFFTVAWAAPFLSMAICLYAMYRIKWVKKHAVDYFWK